MSCELRSLRIETWNIDQVEAPKWIDDNIDRSHSHHRAHGEREKSHNKTSRAI